MSQHALLNHFNWSCGIRGSASEGRLAEGVRPSWNWPTLHPMRGGHLCNVLPPHREVWGGIAPWAQIPLLASKGWDKKGLVQKDLALLSHKGDV